MLGGSIDEALYKARLPKSRHLGSKMRALEKRKALLGLIVWLSARVQAAARRQRSQGRDVVPTPTTPARAPG